MQQIPIQRNYGRKYERDEVIRFELKKAVTWLYIGTRLPYLERLTLIHEATQGKKNLDRQDSIFQPLLGKYQLIYKNSRDSVDGYSVSVNFVNFEALILPHLYALKHGMGSLVFEREKLPFTQHVRAEFEYLNAGKWQPCKGNQALVVEYDYWFRYYLTDGGQKSEYSPVWHFGVLEQVCKHRPCVIVARHKEVKFGEGLEYLSLLGNGKFEYYYCSHAGNPYDDWGDPDEYSLLYGSYTLERAATCRSMNGVDGRFAVFVLTLHFFKNDQEHVVEFSSRQYIIQEAKNKFQVRVCTNVHGKVHTFRYVGQLLLPDPFVKRELGLKDVTFLFS